MGKPKAPPPPDYAAAATAQGLANENATLGSNYLNQIDQITPQGSIKYTYDMAGGHKLPDGTIIPHTSTTTTLSPEQQKLYDQNVGLSTSLNDLAGKGIGYVGDAVAKPLTADSVGQIQGNVGASPYTSSYDYSKVQAAPQTSDFAAQRDQVTNALMARLQPQMDQQQNSLQSRLANQGINLGSDAYKTANFNLAQQQNDQRTSALIAGSDEQQRLYQDAMANRQQGISEAQSQGNIQNQAAAGNFSEGLASGQFTNQAQQQALQEADYFKNQPLNMLNALRTGNQVSMPQFGNVSTGASIQAPPTYQAAQDAGQYAMNAYQNQMGAFGSLLGGLGKIGGAAIAASDRRLKEDIILLGKRLNGLGIYSFRYIGRPEQQIGYMADEVREVFPDAVFTGPDGFAMVDYGKVG